MVASSVPMMESTEVTVVDQKGRLLNSKDVNSDLALSTKQFKYKQDIEDH